MKLRFNTVKSLLRSFLEKVKNKHLTIDELVHKLSTEVDEIIIQTSNENKLNFIGGKLVLDFSNGKGAAAIELFFLDENEEWIKHAMKKRIADKLHPDELKEFTQGSLTFDIAPPETAA